MYENHENVEKTAKKIVGNLNDMAKTKPVKKGKEYIKDGKSTVSVKIPAVDSKIEEKLEKYVTKQAKEIKTASKKVKVTVEAE